MALERRFLTTYREQATAVPGLIQEEDGSVSHVALDGSRTTLPGTGGALPDTSGASEGNVLALGAGLAAGWSLGVQVSRTTLTDAQVKALPSAPLELIGAPGDDRLIILLTAILGPLVGTDYANANVGAVGWLQYGAAASEDATTRPGIAGGVLAGSPRTFMELGSLAAYNGNQERVAGEMVNKGIFVAVDNGLDGDFTGGDPGNTLNIWVVYAVLDLSA